MVGLVLPRRQEKTDRKVVEVIDVVFCPKKNDILSLKMYINKDV